MSSQNRVQWVYSSRDNQELEERYDQWSKDYDRDLSTEFEYRSPRRAAEILVAHVPRDARILDAGAGTGLVGEILASMGYRRMVAMDLSQGMLEEARKKGVYEDFHQMVMGETLDYETGFFDAVITVGVLTVGHAPASSLDELVRVTTAQRPHRLLAAAGRVREQRLSREAGCAGVAGEVAAGGADRGVPADAQGRAGGIAQGLGVPRRRLTGGVAAGQ